MQPPVVRMQIVDFIRQRGEPAKVQEMESALNLPYGNIMQACTRGVSGNELIKTGPAEFGLPGMLPRTGVARAQGAKPRSQAAASVGDDLPDTLAGCDKALKDLDAKIAEARASLAALESRRDVIEQKGIQLLRRRS